MLLAETSQFLFFLLPIAGAMLLSFGIYQAVSDAQGKERNKILQRLQERSGSGNAVNREKRIRESLLRKQNQQETNPFLQMVSSFKMIPRIQGMLDQANVDMTAAKWLTAVSCTALLLTIVFVSAGVNVLIAIVVGTASLFLPLLWLKWKKGRRINKLVNQLPDVFEMMSQSLRAGHSLAGAVQLVSEQLPDPVGTEFARVFHEQNFGIKMEDALLNFAKRTDQMDIRFFVTAVLIQRQTGGDLAEILDKISTVIRGRVELLGTIRGLTAEGRMSGWVLFALPIVVFFASYWINRDYVMVLLTDDRGRMLACVAGMMQLMGLAMIKKIVSIKL